MENSWLIESIIALSTSEIGIYDTDKKQLAFSSGKIGERLGYTKEQMIEMSKNKFLDVMHPDDKAVVIDSYERIMDSTPGEIIEQKVRVKKSNGSYLWVLSRNMVLDRTEEGIPSKFVGVLDDVTELVELQEALKEHEAKMKNMSCPAMEDMQTMFQNMIQITSLIGHGDFKTEFHWNIFNYLSGMLKRTEKAMGQDGFGRFFDQKP